MVGNASVFCRDNYTDKNLIDDVNCTEGNLTANSTVRLSAFTADQVARAQWLWWICYPVLLACCTVGNGLNLVVLIRQAKKNSTTSYMIAMAFSDLVVLWLFFPIFLWNLSRKFNLPYGIDANKATIFQYMGIQGWMQEAFMHLCDWVLLIFSAERLMAFVKPFWIKKLTSAFSANIIVVVLFVSSAMFSVENFVYERYCTVTGCNTTYSAYMNEAAKPAWLLKWGKIQNTAELSVNFGNFFLLLLINSALIAAITKQHRQDLGRVKSAQFPSLLYKALELADTLEVWTFDKNAREFPSPICNVTLLANYSVNFFLYLTVSKRYRLQCTRTLQTCCGITNIAVYFSTKGSVGLTGSTTRRQRMLRFLTSKPTKNTCFGSVHSSSTMERVAKHEAIPKKETKM
ncbi:uncharacterized protein LOC129598724 isoform X2 [Paramacrobiotus metropolitanus]|uniref:uncharacterized protein LOC129598724 isoform X2 n=1 Tax=Paramacrobiotus metropolitanus TaxID=2943436 RepID=UPI00244565E9|nr:uncharacterized protein LOC129598724 isoform X2 [Paramacrobiotus metropolitanus]